MTRPEARLPLFVFDFDGVVCDSTDECMVTSWNAWQQWRGGSGFRRSTAPFSESERSRFRALRPRVRGAGEYYVLLRSFDEGVDIKGEAAYEALVERWREHIGPFARLFFSMRDRLRDEDLALWIDLHPVYGKVVEVMTALHRERRLYIATLKDGRSVRLILARHGLELEPERVLDESMISSKLEALDAIRERAGCAKADMIFIDDNATHLVEPHAAGYAVWLAAWGATFPDYVRLAAERGIRVMDSEASVSMLAFGGGVPAAPVR